MNNMKIKVSVKDIPEVIEQLQQAEEKINNLQSKIDKAIEWLDYENMGGYFECPKTEMKELLDILKEDK